MSGDITLSVQEGNILHGAEVFTEGNSVRYVAQNLVVNKLTGNHAELQAENRIDQNGLVQAQTEYIQINANSYSMEKIPGWWPRRETYW